MISVAARTHAGIVRPRNEDAIVLPGMMLVGGPVPVSLHFGVSESLTFAVIDGMGGHRGGQEASRSVAQQLLDHGQPDISASLDGANRTLHDEMRRTPELSGMGATIAGIIVNNDQATIFNVGDARVYEWAEKCLMLRSVDDRVSASSNVITQSLGGSPELRALSPHVSELALSAGTRILICTDGLSDVLSFDSLQDILGEPSAETALAQLVDATLAAGAPDNVSVILLDADGGGEAS